MGDINVYSNLVKTPGGILIHSEEPTEQDCKSERLKEVYDKWESVRAKAAQIHHSRMLPGEPCDQCIEIACHQLGIEL